MAIQINKILNIIVQAIQYSDILDEKYVNSFVILTLVLLNKLRCHALFKFSANQITGSRLLI